MEKLLVQGHTDSSLVFISGGPSASDDGFGETCKAPSIARATNNLIRMNYGINPWKTNDRMGIHDKTSSEVSMGILDHPKRRITTPV